MHALFLCVDKLKVFGLVFVVASLLLLFWEHSTLSGEHGTELANPASTYCVEHGGQLKMVHTEKGETGICVINGVECEEWAFYRGECP